MTISFTSRSSKRDGVGGGGKRQTNRETEMERERETERGRAAKTQENWGHMVAVDDEGQNGLTKTVRSHFSV